MGCEIGLERVLAAPPNGLVGQRFGVLVNQASVDSGFRFSHELLHERFPGQLQAVFGPQHGLFCEQQDNMIETPHSVDAATGVPVFSLYADRRKPTAEMLEGLDVFVVDLQDVGTRVYTYIWTLSYCLEACAAAGVRVLVLDRPNPLGGDVFEGPRLAAGFESFVGRAGIPMRHGLTMGEAALYLNDAMGIGAAVEVVTMSGYRRGMLWPETGRAWIPTSPNLPRLEGVLVYPGQVLLEGTTLSEGRSTTTPFEVVGAPGIDPAALMARMAEVGHAGLVLRPIRFEPTFQKHAGVSCAGVYLHPVDPAALRSYRATVALLAILHEEAPDGFAWKQPPYEYEEEKMPIDILAGDDRLRQAIEAGRALQELDALTAVDAAGWQGEIDPFRLYD